MLVFGTQMHLVTLVFIFFASIFFFIQLYDVIRKPQDRRQWWYLILLFILLHFDITNSLFPDAHLVIPLKLQYILAYGFAYLMGAYFPFYFFKVFDLARLRFHATWGVGCFILLPYGIFAVWYAIDGRLVPDREWTAMVPALYGIIVLVVMLRSVRSKFRETGSKRIYRWQLAVLISALPWELMSVFAFYAPSQELRMTLANLGWMVISLLMIARSVRRSRRESEKLLQMKIHGIRPEAFLENCARFELTKREIEIVTLLRQGLKYKVIAERLFISELTVKKHVQHIFEKTSVSGRSELIHKLEYSA
jgi:DNA-binding CsgD family transcriptional regulator